jgi:phage protein D
VALPAYVVDGRSHAYRHIATLARLCGFDAYLTPEDELVFGPFTRTTADHTFVYAEDVLDLSVDSAAPAFAQVIVIGESTASGQGNETWHWLASDWSSYKGSAGAGDPALLVQARGARTNEAAQAMADGLLDQSSRGATRGTLRALGRAEVRVGDAVEMTGAPDGALNGLYQVIGVRHRLDRASGFLTTLDLIGAAGAGGLGDLLGGLL